MVYDRITDPMAAIATLGRDIAHSQMFGCSNEEQGRVLAMTCFARRTDPLTLAESYHLIQNRLSMKADKMLSGLHERGGRHRIIQRSAEAAEIEITHDGDTQRFSLSWEEAQKEPFVWAKEKNGKRPIKDNWATPRSRMQMLWARVVSDGVRAMCPGVVCGSYAPEEIADMDEGSVPAGSVVIDAVIEPAGGVASARQETPPFDTESTTSTGSTDGYANAGQVSRITNLYVELNVPFEVQEAALAKRGVKTLRSLTYGQAGELLEKLEGKRVAAQAADEQSRNDESATSLDVDGPATQVQIDQVKQLIAEVAQNGQPDIAKRVKAKLESSGLQKLADLSIEEIGRLYAALQIKNIEAFFALSLAGHTPKN